MLHTTKAGHAARKTHAHQQPHERLQDEGNDDGNNRGDEEYAPQIKQGDDHAKAQSRGWQLHAAPERSAARGAFKGLERMATARYDSSRIYHVAAYNEIANVHNGRCIGQRMNPPGRVLALDLGKKRIGLAISDGLGLTAQGLPTLERRNKRTDLAALAALIKKSRSYLIIDGQSSAYERRRGTPIGAGCGNSPARWKSIPAFQFRMWDERLTTRGGHTRFAPERHQNREARRRHGPALGRNPAAELPGFGHLSRGIRGLRFLRRLAAAGAGRGLAAGYVAYRLSQPVFGLRRG